MAITLSSSNPAQGSTDFFINKPIELVFDKSIATASLTNTIFAIIDIDTGSYIPITITAGINDDTKVYLLPSLNLRTNAQYRILILGTDAGLGTSLTAQDADTLTTTITIEFTSGSTVYKIDTTVEKEASNLTLEGDLFLPTNVKAVGLDFTISKVRPKNNQHAIPVNLTGDNTVTFTFSKNLYTGTVDYTEWVDVSLFSLLNSSAYLASGSAFGVGTIPDYTVSVTGQELKVTFDHEVPNNVGIQISLLDGIQSLAGDEYGGSLLYSINTALYPEIYGVETIKREVRELTSVYKDDYIGALLFKNTVLIWESVGRSFSIDSPSIAAKQYVLYATILDLLEDAEYTKYLVAGTRRQLGDLGISIDNLIGKTAMKVAKYQKLKEIAKESLMQGWQFKVGTSTVGYDSIASEINRLWYDINGRYTDSRYSYTQDDVPAANVSDNRRARSNNPSW